MTYFRLLHYIDFNTTIDLCDENFKQINLYKNKTEAIEDSCKYFSKDVLDITTNDNCLLIRIILD